MAKSCWSTSFDDDFCDANEMNGLKEMRSASWGRTSQRMDDSLAVSEKRILLMRNVLAPFCNVAFVLALVPATRAVKENNLILSHQTLSSLLLFLLYIVYLIVILDYYLSIMDSIHSTALEQFEPRGKNLMDVHPHDDGTDDDNLASSILSNSPRLSTKCHSNINNTLRPEEVWTIRQVPNGEEELYSRGKCVYWTRNSVIIKSFNFTDQVVKVFWAQFANRDHTCVALTSGLSIFNKIGQHFQIPLPFAYQKIFPTKLGLIIERTSDPIDDSSLPILFALTHPTQEVSPILFKPSSRGPQHGRMPTYSMPSYMSLVACHDTLPLCLMYNSQDCQHSIWRMRRTTKDEVDDYQRIHDESTANTFANHQSSCSFRESFSQASLNISSKQKSNLMHQSNPSSTSTINFSPKMDLRSRHSVLGNLAASRLGVGGGQMTPEANSTNIKSFNSANTINLISTPNRNRIINYLRDNIEEPIMPELTHDQIWLESSTSSLKANKFFSTSDLIGNEYIVIVTSISTQIKVIKCETLNSNDMVFGRASFVTAIDAMPLPTMKMMVVIDSDKNLALYSGFDRITNVNVPHMSTPVMRALPTSTPASMKHSVEMTPIQMSSARKRSSMGERSSLGADLSIQQMFQALSPVPHAKHESKASSPLNLNDVKKIEYTIGKSVFILNNNGQRARFDIPTVCQTVSVRRLLDSMKLLVSRELGLTIMTKWFQTRRASSQPEFMHAKEEMKLFKNWFLKSISLTSNFFDEKTSLRSHDVSAIRSIYFSPSKKSRRAKDSETNPMTANVYTLFYAMHLVFEDIILTKLNYEIASDLVELLLVLACLLRLDEYQEYYWLKFPHLQTKFGSQKSNLENVIPNTESFYKPPFFQTSPPSITDFISKIITASQLKDCHLDETLRPYPNIANVTEDAYSVISLFSEMFNLERGKAILSLTPSSQCPSTNVLSRQPYRSKSADEHVVMLMVQLGKTRDYLACLPEGINLYLWDSILNCRESPPTNWSEACFNLIGRMDLVSLVRGRTKTTSNDKEDETLKLIFPDDIRVSEAQRMLASDVPIEFSVTQRQGATEEESREETHKHLYLLNVRTMAMPVGRGAICLRTYSPVIGESFEVPRLELSGRAFTEERPIEYTHDITVYPWPFFHNGVAAGLTICSSTVNNIIDSTWINYNRPRSNIPHGADARDRDLTAANINNEHAGFLFALGLNGHLEKLSLMALHDYLCQNNDLTKLAILLGMSAAKRGSRDNNIIKVLSIHVDALLPPNSTELDVPAPVHAASIIGVGLLYQGSGDSHISKVLLEEIGRLPGPETNSHVDRESYSLSAGLAFGLVNLCRGGSSTISSSDQLRLYMLGGRRKPLTLAQRERYFKQDCHRGEEEYINTHITSPGGTLGLGLMYHRSGNQSVANWMKAPDTQTLLEYVRPDFLISRMLSYGLIMWNEIEPSEDWINSHIPKIVSTHAFQKNSAPPSTKLAAATTVSIQTTDYELISQAYCNIVAGCCMAMAMRFAGTANRNAYKTIYKHTKMLIALSNKPALVEQAGRPCIEACLNVLVTSLAVVMAGTGDLGVMRVCRYLRSRLTQNCVFYGSYMAMHMALGILFLGACRYSLSTSPDSIGALVCALYPIYPNHSSDNRYHLQALRHLYVLAAEPRLLIPRDIQTNKPVYVMISVKQRNESNEITEFKLKAPCLMPEVESIESVCVDDDRYWRIEITSREALKRCLFQDQGCLSVKQKAHSSNNQLVKDIEAYILQNMPQGIMKSRKSSALAECVKEDRVEQYSALNELLVKIRNRDVKFKSLGIEQVRIANTLSENKLMCKMNLLKPVVGEYAAELPEAEIYGSWCNYLAKVTNWTNTNAKVAHFATLNDLQCEQVDADLVEALQNFDFQSK